jgi:peptidoglycan/xylan/chitin deacetylase (PgdA/CDA1 family)
MIDGREVARKLFLNVARYSGLAPALAPVLSGIGVILMLHRVNDEPETGIGLNSHLTVTPAFLDAVLETMKRMGYSFVSMDEAVERIGKGGGSGRFAAITLDDGYFDNYSHALPVFEAHEAPFTIYVAPGLTERRLGMWWHLVEELVAGRDWLGFMTPEGQVSIDCRTRDQKIAAARQLQDYLTHDLAEEEQFGWLSDLMSPRGRRRGDVLNAELMNWDEIRKIAAHPLGTIGAHTVHHYNLSRLSPNDAMREMVDSGEIIAIETGEAPRHFAYPYGHAHAVGEREVMLAREAGYASAVTTRHGVLQAEHGRHPHALPRISVNGRYQQIGYVRTMLSGLTTLADARKRLVTV